MTTTAIVVAIIVVVAVAVAVWLFSQRRRSTDLRERFGPEYDHAVREYGDSRRAENALEKRAERFEQLHIRSLPAEQSAGYAEQWRRVQAQFVDSPAEALAEADRLVTEVMQARGYPMGDFEQRAADVSVEHPRVVEHYRAAHAIAGRSSSGEASTEDVRQGLVHYRALFDELIETREPAGTEVRG
ncbi:MAG TPA: hypothetical protein VFA49_01915 [Chloroflexota bacterium]|jgi:hypothetical protein|nr:hypothetical protein [Chloroflexota bacterium]